MKRILSLFLAIVAVAGIGLVLPVTAEDDTNIITSVITQNVFEDTTETVTEATTEVETEYTTDFTTEASTEEQVVSVPGTPVIKSLKNANSGLVFVWDAVDGATGYRVYRRAAGERSWTYLGTVKTCSYTDKKTVSGTSYRYTVRAVNQAGRSGYDKAGITTKRLSSPAKIKASNVNGSVNVTWGTVKGATGYRVYRRCEDVNGWVYLKTVKECKYTDKNVNNGKYYRYTVRAVCGKVYSGYYSEGSLVRCVSTPVTQKIVTYPKKLVFTWGKVNGATSYRVYKRGAGESWKLISTVKGTSYTDTDVVKNTSYRYTVKAVSDGYLSGYDSAGVVLRFKGVNGQTIYGKNAKYLRPGTINNPTIIDIDEANWNLTVVNSGYRIPSDYEPDLVYVCGSTERLDRKVAVQYEKMYKAAAKDGVYLTPCSGYRSYSLQERNYNRKVEYYKSLGYSISQAKVKAATIIMPPGSSEHNLGYAMDIVCVDEWFEDTKEFKWLQKNAANYGFIMRYPKDKQNITKVIYEPWHWRYVGVEAAKAMKSSGLTLEEYMGVKQ
ncbi:MAG: D-alanyl-D-alanine carboxypeptidase family protein [Clostridia bacterium]|nr:D-alanyl-D-alanine carboxypeptidase family protein [Clostridia bacterium]